MEQISPIQALLQQRTLLQLEYYTEKEAFRKLTEQMGMQRKVKRGDAWFPLRVGKNFYNSLNQTAIEVFRTSDQDIEHNFEFGRPVMFFMVKKMGKNEDQGRKVQSIKYFSFTGTVSYVDGDRMVITVPDSAPLLDLQQSTEPIGVQLSFDETSYKLMFEALDRVMKAKNNRLAYLRDLFYSHQKAGRFSFEPMKFPWLNPTQERAVNEVLWAKDVAIVHGPPGTGKTTTLVEAINETLMRESQVLVCAQSNMAVDWISEKEAACWIPMKRASRVILAGDHCQLPPTVKSIAALRAGLGKTLMERIAENKPEVVTLLKIQYRMNDEIMRFSSDWFYGGKVESAPQIKYRSVLDYDHPITWIDTSNEENQITIEGEDAPEDSASAASSESASSSESTSSSVSAANQNSDLNFKEQFVGESFGRINKAEAELTLLTLAEYFTKIGKQRVLSESIDVGIISPYRAQVQYLKKLIKKYEFFKPYRRLISVNTVDGFQGQERDVILISLVRSNDEGQIGFLKDLRRMNVAMTRARMKLIILGNKDTMTKHPFYKKLWEYVEAINHYE